MEKIIERCFHFLFLISFLHKKKKKKGWVECVGHADRACYDLSSHSSFTKQPLQAFIEFKDGARDVEMNQLFIEKSIVGKQFGKESSVVIDYLNALDESALSELETSLKAQG